MWTTAQTNPGGKSGKAQKSDVSNRISTADDSKITLIPIPEGRWWFQSKHAAANDPRHVSSLVREFGKKHGGVLIRLIVSNGANVLGRQKDCQANVCCRATDFEESPKRV